MGQACGKKVWEIVFSAICSQILRIRKEKGSITKEKYKTLWNCLTRTNKSYFVKEDPERQMKQDNTAKKKHSRKDGHVQRSWGKAEAVRL